MTYFIQFIAFTILFSGQAFSNSVADTKEKLLDKALYYQGQGDPDRKIQDELQLIVNELLKKAPQKPVKDRLALLYGSWKQVWGPYDYRGKKRGVDSSIKADEIYQTIFKDGYYYNTSPVLSNKSEKIGLLRGEFNTLRDKNTNLLKIQFTNYPGLKTRPNSIPLWKLPDLVEKKLLKNPITIVPTFVVKYFFSGGFLNEVYTDEDLRVTYGTDNKGNLQNYLYVMKRVKTKTN